MLLLVLPISAISIYVPTYIEKKVGKTFDWFRHDLTRFIGLVIIGSVIVLLIRLLVVLIPAVIAVIIHFFRGVDGWQKSPSW